MKSLEERSDNGGGPEDVKLELPPARAPFQSRAGGRAVEMVPTLVTLGNLFSGFLAIAYLTDSLSLPSPTDPQRILLYEKAIGLIFLAMVFDALDGWVARKLGHSSAFGAQVDSICDAVSFGAAPALLFKVVCEAEPHGIWPKLALALAVGFLACAVLRLARFNLETEDDETSHTIFEGLPTPAAAAVVAALTHANIALDPTEADSWVRLIMPPAIFILSVLMVSRVPYPHVAIWLFRRKSLPMLALLIFISLTIILAHEVMVPVLCVVFAMSGPTVYIWRRLTGQVAGTPLM